MSTRLKSLTVENFRSIRGRIQVSLDAPVVLIHGSNGTGKTSLLSALELGLTGAVVSLARVDDHYIEHLPHKDAADRRGRVTLGIDGLAGAAGADISVTGTAIVGQGVLDAEAIRFFSERCYLEQATLARLLEIYQHQDTRQSDSPLTRFVKELLGLEPLDALIDGLRSAGDVRRLREPVPVYWEARENIPLLRARAAEAEQVLNGIREELATHESVMRRVAANLTPSQNVALDTTSVRSALTAAVDADELALLRLARVRRDLIGAADQVRDAASADEAAEGMAIEASHAAAQTALNAWLSADGAALETVVRELQAQFSDLPEVKNDPVAAHAAAVKIVNAELARIDGVLEADASDASELALVQDSVRQGRARIEIIDAEIAAAADVSGELAQALAAITPHIHDDTCPVCGRDFNEVSDTPLAAHVSEHVARLVDTAGRLQSLSRDKATTGAAVTRAQRTADQLLGRRLTSDRSDALKNQQARLKELFPGLQSLAPAARRGAELRVAMSRAAEALAARNSRDSSIAGLRALIGTLTAEIGLAVPVSDAPLALALANLQRHLDEREETAVQRQASRRQALEAVPATEDLRRREATAAEQVVQHQKELQRLTTAKAEADRRIELARNLARRTRDLRTEIVRQVFNDELNAIWRDLFIRLAPDEPFVPAFALPTSSGGPVEAVLETHYRSGGRGGNPRAMLSAGNLNTAALTLFLALHLSVKPILPWLIVDDPVQSMDEVHVAQFAALLRTLKQKKRQIIIAAHERSLFDYLTLELSPTFLGDRLITIELGRTPDAMTTAPWSLRTFQPDRAIAA